MISSRDLEKHFTRLPGDQLDILLEIHRIVMQVSPGAVAEIRRYGVVYYDAGRGEPVSAGICQTLVKPDYICLAFVHGAFLPDLDHLLRGGTYPKRYLEIASLDNAPRDTIQAWIKNHAHFDLRTLPENIGQKHQFFHTPTELSFQLPFLGAHV
jgi:hypothetical protein